MARPSSKEAILDAAEEIVMESGALHLTFDAVAERAGISKGGLIYNFPSKSALLEAMISRMAERFVELREKARQESPEYSKNELMVEIRSLQGKSKATKRLGAALLAVVANQPELVAVVRKTMGDRLFFIAKDGDFVSKAILFFAAFGLHFHDLLNLSLLDEQQQTEIFDELLRLAAEFGDI